MLLHFFHGSYFYLNYVVDVALLVGSMFAAIQWWEHRRKKQSRKKKEALKDDIRDGVYSNLNKLLPDAVADELDATLPDLIDASVEAYLGQIKEQLEFVVGQVGRNGGSSLRDSVDRQEKNMAGLIAEMSSAVKILDNQQHWLAKVSEDVEVTKTDIAHHLGYHEGISNLMGKEPFSK